MILRARNRSLIHWTTTSTTTISRTSAVTTAKIPSTFLRRMTVITSTYTSTSKVLTVVIVTTIATHSTSSHASSIIAIVAPPRSRMGTTNHQGRWNRIRLRATHQIMGSASHVTASNTATSKTALHMTTTTTTRGHLCSPCGLADAVTIAAHVIFTSIACGNASTKATRRRRRQSRSIRVH